MKTVNSQYFLNTITTTLQLCQRKLKSFSLLPLLSSLEPHWFMLLTHARQVLAIGLAASRAHVTNKRHLVGDLFLLNGGIAFFFHQFFSSEVIHKDWYYVNWFYFFYAIRPYTMLFFWSVTAYMYSTAKSGKIIFTSMHCGALLGIIHYSFFVYDFETYHMMPYWDMWIMAGAFGVGFILAVNHLVYVWEHKIKGNHKRAIGIGEMNIDAETKARLLKDVANEYRKLYTHY